MQILLGDASLPELPSDLHLEAAGVITDYSIIYREDSNPSCDRASSSQGTSFYRLDKKISGTKATRLTF